MTARTLSELIWRLKPGGPASDLPPLVLMTDPVRLPDPAAAIRELPKGSAVIVRHPDAAARRDLAVRLAPLCRTQCCRLLVSVDARLARAIGDGLHLPERELRRDRRRWIRWRRPGWLVTAAAHGPAALQRAAQVNVDAVLLSPVFPTRSHPEAEAIGPLRFAAWIRRSGVPVYALGGVTPVTAARLAGSRACGFAAIDALAGPSR